METNAIDNIRTNLNGLRGSWPSVCSDTGLDYSWLTKFAQGKIPNPGFAKMQILSAYLAKLGASDTAKKAA